MSVSSANTAWWTAALRAAAEAQVGEVAVLAEVATSRGLIRQAMRPGSRRGCGTRREYRATWRRLR
jgi:hypothetical protein